MTHYPNLAGINDRTKEYVDNPDAVYIPDKSSNVIDALWGMPELFYFDLSGRANLARTLMDFANVKYKDTRFTFQEWPAHRSDYPISKCFGSVPVMEHNGVVFSQSRAISAYAAELAHLVSIDAKHAAFESMLLSTHADLQKIMLECLMGDEESKKKANSGLKESLAKFLVPLERMMPDKGFLHGRQSSIRFGDVII